MKIWKPLYLKTWLNSTILFCVINLRTLSVKGQDEELLWRCDNAQCINIEDVCDGKVDCSDGSDETARNCIATECRRINFVCTYGACVTGTSDCNGTKECADGSDESPALCQKESWEAQLKGRCRNNEMQCKSGECISSDDKCDGHRNCQDGSDETLEVCSAQICPPKSFRCGYGACVSGTATCNYIEDCADGSDESPILCGRDISRTCSSSTDNSLATTDGNVFTNPEPNRAPCRVPYQGNDTIIVRNEIFTNIILKAGEMAVDSTPVKYECLKGYTLKGEKRNVCNNGHWRKNWPKCFRCCPDTHPRSGYSTAVIFTLDGVDKSSSTCFEPNTVAKFSCLEGFFRPDNGFVDETRCKDGIWTRNKQPCNMDCGSPVLPFTEFSTGGIGVNITEYPWHVGIYIESGKKINQICTGTLISPRRVVSAAHCFFPENEPVVPDRYTQKTPYWIASGKYYKDFNHAEDTQAIKRKVVNIWIPHDFTGRQSRYHHDVSILMLEDFVPFSYYARPICVEHPELAFRNIQSDTRGHFTAWNKIQLGKLESTLEKVPGNVLDFKACKERVFEISHYNIPGDKFCVVMENEIKVCKGDSGSGFVVFDTKKQAFKLIGVVSFSPRRTQDCGQDSIVVMTNILDIPEILSAKHDDLHTEINYDLN